MKKNVVQFFIFTLAVFSCLSSARAFAEPSSFLASDLLMMCTSTSDVDFGYCAGYVSAHADQMLSEPVYGMQACNHQKVRSQQLVDIFTGYVELFPENKEEPAGKTVAAAIARAFPCKK